MRSSTRLALAASLLLALPSAAAGPGAASVCNGLGTGACASATLTPTLLSCADVAGVWTCEVRWELHMDVTPFTCASASSTETGRVIVCNPFPQPAWNTLGVPRTYAVPAGGALVVADAEVCVDALTPLEDCAAFQASIGLPGP